MWGHGAGWGPWDTHLRVRRPRNTAERGAAQEQRKEPR